MRALFVAGPGVGHAFPMVPLAWALRAAGHEVLFATAGPGTAVAAAGLPVADLRPGWDYRAVIAARWRPAEGVAGAPRRPDSQVARRGSVEPFAPEALRLAGRWQPEVVVGRTLALLVAAGQGVPFVDHGVGLMRTAAPEELDDRLRPLFARHGLSALPPRRLPLEVAPPSMLDRAPGGQLMRYVPYNGGGVVPDGLLAPAAGARPRVAVTLGTAVPLTHGLGSVARLLPLVAEVEAEFLLALGDVDTATLPPLPGNVRALGWAPLNLLLESCAAVVHHGGEGTAMTALALGVPQLVLADGIRNGVGDSVAARGVGRTATPEDLHVEVISDLLADDTLHRTAREVAAEIAQLPPPSAVVPAIEALR